MSSADTIERLIRSHLRVEILPDADANAAGRRSETYEIAGIGALAAALGEERDELLNALKTIAVAEADYRKSFELKGSDHIETGRAWDLLRRAGDQARLRLRLAKADGGWDSRDRA